MSDYERLEIDAFVACMDYNKDKSEENKRKYDAATEALKRYENKALS